MLMDMEDEVREISERDYLRSQDEYNLGRAVEAWRRSTAPSPPPARNPRPPTRHSEESYRSYPNPHCLECGRDLRGSDEYHGFVVRYCPEDGSPRMAIKETIKPSTAPKAGSRPVEREVVMYNPRTSRLEGCYQAKRGRASSPSINATHDRMPVIGIPASARYQHRHQSRSPELVHRRQMRQPKSRKQGLGLKLQDGLVNVQHGLPKDRKARSPLPYPILRSQDPMTRPIGPVDQARR